MRTVKRLLSKQLKTITFSGESINYHRSAASR